MKLALFDLDNTLLDGDSDYAWAQFLIEEGVLHPDHYHARNVASGSTATGCVTRSSSGRSLRESL